MVTAVTWYMGNGAISYPGAIVRLPQCQWSKPDGYGKISQCITTTKHSKAKTVCIFLGIYCILLCSTVDRFRWHRAHQSISVCSMNDMKYASWQLHWEPYMTLSSMIQTALMYLLYSVQCSMTFHTLLQWLKQNTTSLARFVGPTLGPSGADRTQVGPMLVPWTLLSGKSEFVLTKSRHSSPPLASYGVVIMNTVYENDRRYRTVDKLIKQNSSIFAISLPNYWNTVNL